jgi:hypothetical protein
MRKKITAFRWGAILLIAGFIFGLAACAPQSKPITGSQRETVLAYTEPIADGELQAYNDDNYEAFVSHYDATMLKLTDKASFDKLYTTLSTKLGKYVSSQVQGVYETGTDQVTVVYLAKFEKDSQVTINMTFQTTGEHQIMGLYFNSPELQKK